jgi:hypothetical protein
MLYLLYLPLNLAFDAICLILNPVVVLFADKNANLPNWLYWFQTQDSSIDPDIYGWGNYYPGWHTTATDPKWRILLYQYIRRVFWLYRNTGYDFAYSVCGYNLDGKWIIADWHGLYFAYDSSKSLLTRGWCLAGQWHTCGIYLGWKQKTMDINGRTMLAMNANPFKGA